MQSPLLLQTWQKFAGFCKKDSVDKFCHYSHCVADMLSVVVGIASVTFYTTV